MGRLKSRAQNSARVRVLSLCSGEARVEAEMATHAGSNVEWSLMDINVDLLAKASGRFPSDVKVELIEANVNQLDPTEERWDIIICVSAMHHVVELERLVEFCHSSLENGELWLYGEYVGRNGNQLWPEARAVADKTFQALPKRYRLNRNTGIIDETLPVNDFSVGHFEGIRSQEIEAIIDRWFCPVEVYRSNCFLWRLLNLAYNDNYDTQSAEDRSAITNMIEMELSHFRGGGRGTELFGIYRPRNMG